MRRIIRSLLYTLACVGAVALLAGARGNTAVAATTVSGYISDDTTWTAANSPYSVSGNVIVRSGATLTIEPGVTVNFGTDKSLQVDGTLIAKGTSAWQDHLHRRLVGVYPPFGHQHRRHV